jgi:type II secretory pathway component PulJ
MKRLRLAAGTRGVALLEAIIALAILSIGGLSTLVLVDESLRAEREAQVREELITISSRVLSAMTLLQRGELDQRLGSHDVGELMVRVTRPEKSLYRLAIAEKKHPDVDLLVTVVFKP